MKINARQIILVLVILAIVFSIIYLEKQKTSQGDSKNKKLVALEKSTRVAQKKLQYQQAPELQGITGYLNTNESLTLQENIGKKVILIDF